MKNKLRQSGRSTLMLASCNMGTWFHTPRTLITLVCAAVICFIEMSKIFHPFSLAGYKPNLLECLFLISSFGFNILLSGMMFLVMISELPKRIAFQNYAIIRVSRKQWLHSQVLYCLSMVLVFLLLLCLTAFVLCAGRAAWDTGWSELIVSQGASAFRWMSQYTLDRFTPFGAFCASLLPIASLWFTLSMYLLMMNLFGMEKLGIIPAAFLLTADYICVQSQLPFRPMAYATFNNIDNGCFWESYLIMIAINVVLNVGFYVAMRIKVQKMDIRFDPEQNG